MENKFKLECIKRFNEAGENIDYALKLRNKMAYPMIHNDRRTLLLSLYKAIHEICNDYIRGQLEVRDTILNKLSCNEKL